MNIFTLIQSVKINWFQSEKYFCIDESVLRQITGSIIENLTDLESIFNQIYVFLSFLPESRKGCVFVVFMLHKNKMKHVDENIIFRMNEH